LAQDNFAFDADTFISGEDMNSVEIAGIVSHLPQERELASGSRVLSWRIKVPREQTGSDSIPCAISVENVSKSLISRIESLEVGQTVSIEGLLRSRFWQGSAGNASRVEVEVTALKKIPKNQLH
jgi:single-strand DNA-binding protein